jgi:hypothetical protein
MIPPDPASVPDVKDNVPEIVTELPKLHTVPLQNKVVPVVMVTVEPNADEPELILIFPLPVVCNAPLNIALLFMFKSAEPPIFTAPNVVETVVVNEPFI